MGNAVVCAKRRASAVATRRCPQLSAAAAMRSRTVGQMRKWKQVDHFVTRSISKHRFSTGFASVHGERASAEYAKLRKESLETEFGHLLGKFGSKSISAYHRFGPLLALYRAGIISFHVVKLMVWQVFVRDIRQRAVKLRETLIQLGPFYVKLGQALSTRPDILPSAYCQELSKLQVRHMFEEIDYILEAQNADRFAALYACYPKNGQNVHRKPVVDAFGKKVTSCIRVPRIYWEFTRKAVVTMEWIDGIKLIDAVRLEKACLNRKLLINQGLYCSLRQMLEEGFFHADPHPGNLVATSDGSLAYFDFGMMGDLPRHYRVGLIQMLVHFVNRDSLSMANDFLSLGFIPEGTDVQSVADALQSSFGHGRKQSQDFQGIMNQLYDVMYEFNFSLPPDYALVIRALGSLEGTAKILDPDFQVVESAYPYVIGRLLADPTHDMRKILRELLICNNGSIRWNRLERLVMAISESAEPKEKEEKASIHAPTAEEWKSFDMRAVVLATEDLFNFIFSGQGLRVQIFLCQDIVKAADAFFDPKVLSSFSSEGEEKEKGNATITRVVGGLRSFRRAVSMAPEVWIPMLIRTALKPEAHQFVFTVLIMLSTISCRKIPESLWLCISKLLHEFHE
ncbi:protein ACTIVITY OF BC1 COMPLEX KINASE 3, chloroplastic isoform X5 [Nymphaea colorata]|uniref:protein ACTIVITY OF BC1 COMPLEX KINASE 3, chloroplastic isoform X5 n=1 Tax=Nymphaea colorata TaxID=210225 RepID=UPI00129EDDCB|nr:protein ACTIVITY OF BC1 COMPLEX KINASE 3, chloroplastic isoform X5 [Nymphaea colorata]